MGISWSNQVKKKKKIHIYDIVIDQGEKKEKGQSIIETEDRGEEKGQR